MNEQIDNLINKIYDYAKFGSGEKKLVDYVDEIHELIKSERAKAVEEYSLFLCNSALAKWYKSGKKYENIDFKGYVLDSLKEFLAKEGK